MAWQEGGAVGFTAFIHVVRCQADQIGSEVADVATKLRDAAHANVAGEQHSADSLRYKPTDL